MPGLVPGIHVLFDRRDHRRPRQPSRGHKGEARMPEITVSMAAGRTEEQKIGMMRDITQALVKNLGVDADAALIQPTEAQPDPARKGGKSSLQRAAKK